MFIEKIEKVFEMVPRLFAGSIMCFFAYFPGFILYHMIPQMVLEPNKLTWQEFLAIALCGLLLYFFLLVAYRAFTGKGRKKDGGLLPPIIMKSFVLVFGVFAILIIVFGFYEGKLVAIFGGTAYLFLALSAVKALNYKKANDS